MIIARSEYFKFEKVFILVFEVIIFNVAERKLMKRKLVEYLPHGNRTYVYAN